MIHRLLLIRHGVTTWNKVKRFQGHQDVPLSDEGRDQAMRTAEALATTKINRIYTSDLSRSRSTAFIIKNNHSNATFHVTRALREGYGAELEGKIFGKMIGNSEIQSLNSLRSLIKHSGEDLQNIKDRVIPYVYDVFENLPNDQQTIVMVSHGGPIRLLLGHILDMEDETAIKMKIPNCGITTIEYNNGEWEILELNNHDHLKEYIKISK